MELTPTERSTKRPTPLERSAQIAAKLSTSARKLRFATSRHSALIKAVGLRPRRSDIAVRYMFFALTGVLLVAPNFLSIVYYGYVASDQFLSEARFAVRASTPAFGKDQIGKATGIPAAKIVQDTQIVADFITSNEIVSLLMNKIDIDSLYRKKGVDYWSRLPANASIEKTARYWRTMVSATVSPTSGIITLKARAFAPKEAQNIVKAALVASETVVNDINQRIWRDVAHTAEDNLNNSVVALKEARGRLQLARNKSGIVTVEGSEATINALLEKLGAEQLELQQRLNVQKSLTSELSPRMKVLTREIESREAQISNLRLQLAGQSEISTLADISGEISQKSLEEKLAEQRFAASVKTLEQIKFASRQQLLYLDAYVAPTLPDEAIYPRRALLMFVTLIASLLAWASGMLALSAIKRKLA